jgi:DNA-binding MarR family transcriptional regulator
VTLEQRHYERLLDFRTGLRRFLRWSADQAATAGVTPARHQLLLAIRGHPDPAGPTIRDVAGYLLVRHHSAVELVDRAVAAGLVERRQDGDDLRAVRLCLTGGRGRPARPAVRFARGGTQAVRAAARSAVGRARHVPVGRGRVG